MAKDVTQLIKEAAEAVEHVPENLQQVAFSKAFDALIAKQQGNTSRTTGRGERRAAKDSSAQQIDESNEIDLLDRTAHPEITHDGTALNNSLRLLQAARDDFDIDGLSASAIHRVLVEKFRCKVSRQAVSQSLNGAGKYVNRHKEGNTVVFRIMGAGERYLKESPSDESPRLPRRKASGSNKAGNVSTKVASIKKAPKKAPKKKSARQSFGPASGLELLYDARYFSKPRTIREIVDQLKHKHGRTFKQNEMSPPLLRYVRSEKLTRTKNADNQYEYQNA